MDKETLPGEDLFYDSSIGRYCIAHSAKELASKIDKGIVLTFDPGYFSLTTDKPCEWIPE